MNSTNINISTKSIFLLFGLVLLTFIVIQSKDILLLLFGAYIITCSLLPIINFLAKKIPKKLAICIVYAAFLIIIVTLFIPIINILIHEGTEFISQFPAYWDTLKISLKQWNIDINNVMVLPNIMDISTIITKFGNNIINHTINITHNVIVAIVMFTTFVILILFMLLEQDDLKAQFLKFFVQNEREQVSLILTEISKGVGVYVGSKIILMLAVCLMSTAGLLVLNIKFALFLGLLAGILEILPLIGPIIAAIPAVIIAITQDPQLAIWVILLYFIIFKIINNVLSPVILGKFLNISPIIIIAGLFIGGEILGVWGVVLSPAIIVVIYVLTTELYLNKINSKQEKPDIE